MHKSKRRAPLAVAPVSFQLRSRSRSATDTRAPGAYAALNAAGLSGARHKMAGRAKRDLLPSEFQLVNWVRSAVRSKVEQKEKSRSMRCMLRDSRLCRLNISGSFADFESARRHCVLQECGTKKLYGSGGRPLHGATSEAPTHLLSNCLVRTFRARTQHLQYC